jgi:hypothetical protein
VIWLERSQPLFASVAVAALAYQGWLVWRQPARRRTTTALRILWTSIGVTGLVFVAWAGLWLRYR